jgi:hypothetical protein
MKTDSVTFVVGDRVIVTAPGSLFGHKGTITAHTPGYVTIVLLDGWVVPKCF